MGLFKKKTDECNNQGLKNKHTAEQHRLAKLWDAFEALEKDFGVMTDALKSLDRYLEGRHEDLILILGRSGMGEEDLKMVEKYIRNPADAEFREK